eukprot:1675748-Pyramimonas_sp.AAC.1
MFPILSNISVFVSSPPLPIFSLLKVVHTSGDVESKAFAQSSAKKTDHYHLQQPLLLQGLAGR